MIDTKFNYFSGYYSIRPNEKTDIWDEEFVKNLFYFDPLSGFVDLNKFVCVLLKISLTFLTLLEVIGKGDS